MKDLVVALGLILTSPIWLPVLLVYKIFEKPANLTPNEVLFWLNRMDLGEVDGYWWDAFVNVPILGPELDEIREECATIWQEDSGFLYEDEEGEYRLNDKGRLRIKSLIERRNHLNED